MLECNDATTAAGLADAEKQREKCRRFYHARKLRDPDAHRAKQNRNSKAWRTRNPDATRRFSANDYARHPQYHRDASRKSKQKTKSATIAAYGGKCVCGITDPDVLTVDHVGGGGRTVRKTAGSVMLWREAAKKGWPDCYRLLCRNCNLVDHLKRQRQTLSDSTAARRERHRRVAVKTEAFQHYGGAVCADCGEHRDDLDRLSLDHIVPCGGQHRRALGWHFYLLLRKEGWPAGLRVLCHNCNWKRRLQHTKPPTEDNP